MYVNDNILKYIGYQQSLINEDIKSELNYATLSTKYFFASKVVPNAVVTCLLTLALWITISLIHFGIKTGKWRLLKTQNHVNKLNIGHIYTFVVVCGLMVVFYDLVNLVYMNIEFAIDVYKLDEYCDSLSDLAYNTHALIIFTTIIFLWLRQRTFFQNHLLNVNYSKCVKVLSFLACFQY